MVHEQDGLIVRCAQPESLANALRGLLTSNAKTLAIIGLAYRSILLWEHGKEQVIEQYVDLYRQLVREVGGDA